jgi:DNA-binding winged helix-turn-helix (wHTH) protein/TolB-like protein
MSGEHPIFYHFGPFRLDAKQRLLFRHETVVALAPKAFETLLMLVRNYGRLVKRDELLKSVWPDTFVEEAILNQNVLTIRKALGTGQNGADKYIQTIPKRGYRFVAKVTELHEGDARIQAEQSGTLLHNLKVAGADGSERQIDSVAVLPMFNASADPDAEQLCEGFCETIISTLSLIPALKVKACSTLVRYKKKEVDPQEAGRELGVDATLIGKVVSFGERLIVQVELVDVAHGWQLWGKQYNEPPEDVWKIQADVATQVSKTLHPGMALQEPRR